MSSIFDNKAINDARTRCIGDGIYLCRLTDIGEGTSKDKGDGKPVRSFTRLTLSLCEPAKDTDGEVLPVDFPKEVLFGYYNNTQGEEALETANRITFTRMRELIVAALELPSNEKEPLAVLASRGGQSAMIGKQFLVAFSYRKGNQNIDQFIPAGAARK